MISEKEPATMEHTGNISYPITQEREIHKIPKVDKIKKNEKDLEFSDLKPASKVKALKTAIRERTKKLTSHIKNYCETRKPKESIEAYSSKYLGGHIYFDFVHSFLYCATDKVNS